MGFRQDLIKIKCPFCHISTVLSNNPSVHALNDFLKGNRQAKTILSSKRTGVGDWGTLLF
jgi:hypothetical protein